MNTKQFVFDFEQTRSVLNRMAAIDCLLEDMLYRQIAKSKEELTRQINKALYDMAEKQGVSLYDICYNFIPNYGFDAKENRYGIKVEFKPVKLTFESAFKWIKVCDKLPEYGLAAEDVIRWVRGYDFEDD